MNIAYGRAAVAGIFGTLVMTVVGLWIAPLMGLPPMNPADMLAGAMGGSIGLGWMAHLMIGVVLAFIYAAVAGFLPGAPGVRGALFAIAPFLVAQIMMMPMMGMPIFSGSVAMAMGSLVGHLIYGAVVGVTYGAVPSAARAHAAAAPVAAAR